jgi:dolichol kinase
VRAPEGPTLRGEFARKGIHLATASVPIAWAFGVVTPLQVRVALGVAVAVALMVEFARHRRGPFGAAFTARLGAMLRLHERTALSGATWLAIGMWGVAMLAPTTAAIAALWAAAVGDAGAAIVGRAIQRVRGREAGSKSLSGSGAAIALSTLGILWLTPVTLPIALALGGVTALAEWPQRPGDDNVRVAFAVAAAAVLFGLR